MSIGVPYGGWVSQTTWLTYFHVFVVTWIIGGDFDMTERLEDKSNDCKRAISDLERF